MKNNRNIILIVLLIVSIIVIGILLMGNRSNTVETPSNSSEILPTDVPTQEIVEEPEESESQTEEKTVFIGPHQIECVGEGPMLCYQIKENPDDDWLLFYNHIEGFTWEAGYTYELRIAVHPVENPPAGGSSLRYELIEIITKEAFVPEVTGPYIEISAPTDGAVLDPSQTIIVEGMAAGMFEGNVVVQIEDLDGNILLQQPTIQQTDEIGGEGPWRIELDLDVVTVEEGVITAFSPSPKDGSWTASDAVAVKFATIESEAPTLEGPTWLLVEFAEESLNTLLSIHQVTINLDPERGTAAGSAGCNNYFAAYEMNGNNLTLGPAGSTMMMCPDPQMNLETAFLTALAEVDGYQIDGNHLIITNATGELLLKFRVDPYSESDTFTREELGNAIYMCQHAEVCTVELQNGQYYEVPTGNTQLVVMLANHAAFGDLDGDGIEEAVVVLASTNELGTFYDLAVVKKYEGDLINTAITTLGDHLLITDLQVVAGKIIVQLKVPSSDHITCCPDAPVEKRYLLDGGELRLAE